MKWFRSALLVTFALFTVVGCAAPTEEEVEDGSSAASSGTQARFDFDGAITSSPYEAGNPKQPPVVFTARKRIPLDQGSNRKSEVFQRGAGTTTCHSERATLARCRCLGEVELHREAVETTGRDEGEDVPSSRRFAP